MEKGRLEAFSDGVLAIIITIMVLELKAPHGAGFDAIQPLMPTLLAYVLSFIYVGIYWNNHHHLIKAAGHIDGFVLWANLHLLFWLSLIPFATGWMGENHFAPAPSVTYGFVLLMAANAYWILQSYIIKLQGPHSKLKKALGRDIKGKASLLLYIIAMLSTLVADWAALSLYALVAAMWLVPDRRIEKLLSEVHIEPHQS
jgi:uncharacterized membrane protein